MRVEVLLVVDGFVKPVTIDQELHYRGEVDIVMRDSVVSLATRDYTKGLDVSTATVKTLRFERNGTRRRFEGKMLDVFQCTSSLT